MPSVSYTHLGLAYQVLPSHIKSDIAFSALVLTYSGTCDTLKAYSNVPKPTDFTI